ncbi:MAG: hypothetical protein IKP71_02875, partial [Candidatus Riflebacteria bacterium]|nr:hypothetical protein [Candidatus Riflebacteria bacterium]
ASFPANSASIEEFQKEEYYGSGGLDLINAAEAYSKGYTGKGVTIGINDLPVNLEHESFSSKTGSKDIGYGNERNRLEHIFSWLSCWWYCCWYKKWQRYAWSCF